MKLKYNKISDAKTKAGGGAFCFGRGASNNALKHVR